jgi:hypothetical protein
MSRTITAIALAVAFLGSVPAQAKPDEMPWVAVAKDKKGFILVPSGRPFVPWGFNYDHDDKGRLIEDYWDDEWPTVEAHFGQMKKLGANVVRVHLQLGKFMDAPDKPNGKALDRLGKLLALAERLRLYLDLTGLGCTQYLQVQQPRARAGADPLTSVRKGACAAPLSLVPKLLFGSALFRNSVSLFRSGGGPKRSFADKPFPNRSLGTRGRRPGK